MSTQTSPKQQLAQTASFDSAQSHNKRQNFAEDFPDAVAGGSPGDNSFTKVPTLSAEQAALQLSPVVDRAPPPPSPGEEPASHLQPPTVAQHGADQGLETRNSSIKSASQYSTEDDVVPSYLAQSRTQSSRSAYSPFEAAGQGAASQHAMQQLQAAKAAEAQHSRGPSWDSRVDNTQHVSDWAMQAQLQSHMDNSMTPHTQALSCIHARSGSDTPPRIYTTSPPTGIVRAQSAMTRTPSAHHAYPVAAQGSDQRRPRASVGASPRQHRLTSQSDERRASMESYRDVYASSAISSYEVFENLGCSIIPYEELDVKRKIGDGSIGQVYLGRWQQTDVAVKVLTEMQNLASKDEVTPQDPATLQPWETEDSDESCPQQGGQKRTHAKGLIGVTTSTAGDGSPTPQANSAISTLEREVRQPHKSCDTVA